MSVSAILAASAAPPARRPRARHLGMHRDRTCRLLRRYFFMALEVGRLPSLLGREVFRTRINQHRAPSFEDAVIFVHDVERCLERLHLLSRQIVARVVLQNYTVDEAAVLLHCSRRTILRRLPHALDELARMLIAAGMLPPLPPEPDPEEAAESCQEGADVEIRPSRWQ